MRELKFRGYQYEKGIFCVYGLDEKYVYKDTYDSAEYLENIFPIEDINLMQYTGLQEKNGKHIYEGDILEFKNDLGRNSLHKVFRVDGGLVINSHSDDICKDSIVFYEACADMQTSQWIRQCEIIGNIYQNPELLNY